MKETRDIQCSVCGLPDTLIKDAQSGKWEYPEPGWALVNYSHVCPACNAKMIEINRVENEKNRRRFMEGQR